MRAEVISAYLWLIGGLFCLWVGLKGFYYVYIYGAPQWLSGLTFVAFFCFYKFASVRRHAAKSAVRKT